MYTYMCIYIHIYEVDGVVPLDAYRHGGVHFRLRVDASPRLRPAAGASTRPASIS